MCGPKDDQMLSEFILLNYGGANNAAIPNAKPYCHDGVVNFSQPKSSPPRGAARTQMNMAQTNGHMKINSTPITLSSVPVRTRKLRSACDQCHYSKVKCSGQPICSRCETNGLQCAFSYSTRMGKPKGSKNRKTIEKLNRMRELEEMKKAAVAAKNITLNSTGWEMSHGNGPLGFQETHQQHYQQHYHQQHHQQHHQHQLSRSASSNASGSAGNGLINAIDCMKDVLHFEYPYDTNLDGLTNKMDMYFGHPTNTNLEPCMPLDAPNSGPRDSSSSNGSDGSPSFNSFPFSSNLSEHASGVYMDLFENMDHYDHKSTSTGSDFNNPLDSIYFHSRSVSPPHNYPRKDSTTVPYPQLARCTCFEGQIHAMCRLKSMQHQYQRLEVGFNEILKVTDNALNACQLYLDCPCCYKDPAGLCATVSALQVIFAQFEDLVSPSQSSQHLGPPNLYTHVKATQGEYQVSNAEETEETEEADEAEEVEEAEDILQRTIIQSAIRKAGETLDLFQIKINTYRDFLRHTNLQKGIPDSPAPELLVTANTGLAIEDVDYFRIVLNRLQVAMQRLAGAVHFNQRRRKRKRKRGGIANSFC